MIVQQQPRSVCEGLRNLINTTLPENISCNVKDCIAVECLSAQESLSVATLSCNNASITLTVEALDGSTLLYQHLYPMAQPQVLEYTTPRGRQQLSTLMQVQSVNGSRYYIVSLLSSSSEIQLPKTAIPVVLVNCTGKFAAACCMLTFFESFSSHMTLCISSTIV